MFSLDNNMRYWLYNKPVNIRMGFNGLSGIVNNHMGMNIRSGDVFVFVNAARNRRKILHREEGGLVLYSLRIEMGRMRLAFSDETEGLSAMLGKHPIKLISINYRLNYMQQHRNCNR